MRRENGDILGRVALVGIGDRNEGKNHKSRGENGKRNVEDKVDVRDDGFLRDLADKRTDEDRRRRAGERIERGADHVQLIALVAAAAEQVEHRVDDHVQHADREAAHERATQIHAERDKGVAIGRKRDEAGKILDEHTHEARRDAGHCRELIALLCEHLAGGNPHEEIGGKVHHVTHHAKRGRAIDALLQEPDFAHWRGKVRYERNHAVDEHHCDNGNPVGALLLLLAHLVYSY